LNFDTLKFTFTDIWFLDIELARVSPGRKEVLVSVNEDDDDDDSPSDDDGPEHLAVTLLGSKGEAIEERYRVELHNPNDQASPGGEGDNDAVIFMITARDDAKNTLFLSVRNESGDQTCLSHPITVDLSKLLPRAVSDKITVDCPSGWRSSVDFVKGCLVLTPLSPFNFANNGKLTFKLANIWFSNADMAGVRPGLKEVVIFPSQQAAPAPRKVFLKPWVDQPQPLLHFDATFVAVPQTEGWNVQRNSSEFLRIDKTENSVFSNSVPSDQIRTRLAFTLHNSDLDNLLHLTPDSVFKVYFLAGVGAYELAGGADLCKDILIKELGTHDWKISQAEDASSPEWILTPLRDLTLQPQVGSYTFLIDAVLANNKPTPAQDAAVTYMYVSHTKVPLRKGEGFHDDGYLAAKIDKIGYGPQVVSFYVDPERDVYDAYEAITLKWNVLGVEVLVLSYTDVDGSEKLNVVKPTDEKTVTPRIATDRGPVSYKLMSWGEVIAERSVTVKGIREYFDGKTIERQGAETSPNDWPDITLSPATVQLSGNGAILKAKLFYKHDANTSFVYRLDTGWSIDITKDTFVIRIDTGYASHHATWKAYDGKNDIVIGDPRFYHSEYFLLSGDASTIRGGELKSTGENFMYLNDYYWGLPFTLVNTTWAIAAAEGG
jgi:hypothetical protein